MNVTVYRLDDNCYPNSAETASHRLMLGRSLTITTYADANCTDVTSTSTVEQSMLTKSSSGNCVDNDKKFFVLNAQPVFTAVTIYEDNTCSGTPSQIIFSRDFGCHLPSDPENIPCQAFGNSLFSVSSCTNDYNNFTATAFGVTNAFVIEQASSSWCNRVESVTAYSADGVCHNNAVDYSSFRARIDSQGTLAFYKYYDSACTSNRDAATFYKSDLMAQSCRYYDCNLLPSLCSRQECNPWYYSCTRNISVGGLSGTPPTGKYAAVVEYEDNSCSAPAVSVSFTNELGCTSQTDHYDPVCVQDGTVSDCTQYYAGGWDDIGVISEAFGNYPHLVVEKYVWCGMMDTVTDVRVYRLDEKCYPNAAGNESHKLTLGRSVTITTYADADCMDVVTELAVDRSTLLSSGCGAGDRKFLLVNAQSVFTTTAIYEDSKCSGTPSQISFIPAIGCHNVQDSANAPCQAIGNSLFSMSSCTNDYSTFAITVFGVDNPFVIEQGFSSSDCMNAGLITTYAADDNCHAKPNVYRSFRATLDAAGTLVFRTFYDPVCKNDQSTATLLKYQLISPMCMYDNCDVIPLLCSLESCNWWMCGRKLSIGGLDSANALNSAVLVFDDSSCAQVPVQIVVKKQLTCSKEASSCKAVSMAENALYQDHACIEDVATFAKAQFDSSSYLIMEKYRDGTNCEKQKVTVIYKADGLCYSSVDGTSFRVLSSFGESVTFASYPAASCNDDEAEVMAIGSKYINTGACYDGSMRLYGNLVALAPPDLPATCPTPSPTSTLPTPTPTTATTPTPAVNFDQKTREEIMFPEWLWEPTPRRVFVSA